MHNPGFHIIAGPCSIEDPERYFRAAVQLKELGATALRGAIYKNRTRAGAFQGMGVEGIPVLAEVKRLTGLSVVTEITDPRQLPALEGVVDLFQVGARNMYNTELLKELGRGSTPVLLKRGLTAYLDEWASAAEYILRGGNPRVMLCERGIRGFDPSTRNVLDLSAVPLMKKRTGLPVIVDPSHGTGLNELVAPLSRAAAAVGADGLMLEVHPEPEHALSDKDQALTLNDFAHLMKSLRPLLATLTDAKREIECAQT